MHNIYCLKPFLYSPYAAQSPKKPNKYCSKSHNALPTKNCSYINALPVRGLSGKFADTANKTRNMYPRLKKFFINKYQLSSTNYTEYESLRLIID